MNVILKSSGRGRVTQDEKLIDLPRRGQVVMDIFTRRAGGEAHMMIS